MEGKLARARTVTLLGSILTGLSCGTNYVYSAYAPQLGSRLHITYTQLNIIGLSGNMGVYTTGPIVGRIADKKGPRPLLISAFFFLLVGYMGLRVYYDAGHATEAKLPLTGLVALSLCSYMTGAGGSSGLAACANTTAKSFSERMRATTVGLVLSGFGLSAFFFSSLSHVFFADDTSSFLLFLALGTALPMIVGFFTVRPVLHAERPETSPGLLWPADEPTSSTSRLIASNDPAIVVTTTDVEIYSSVEARFPEVIPSIDSRRSSRSPSMELPAARTSLEHRRSNCRRKTAQLGPAELVNTHGKRLLTGWEFWLLFTILSLLSGTGLMYINNVGSVAQALSAIGNPDYNKVEAGKLQAAQVSLISLANCGARIGAGASADFVKHHFHGHRSYGLIAISLLFITSQVVASQVENTQDLWKASLILGLGYGGLFGLLPTVTIEWFGLSHFSENWGFVSLAPLIGGNIFSILFGRDFDKHVAHSQVLGTQPRAPVSDSGHVCLEGRACYSQTLGITTFACTVALLLSAIAAWRDWRLGRMQENYQELPREAVWDAGGDE